MTSFPTTFTTKMKSPRESIHFTLFTRLHVEFCGGLKRSNDLIAIKEERKCCYCCRSERIRVTFFTSNKNVVHHIEYLHLILLQLREMRSNRVVLVIVGYISVPNNTNVVHHIDYLHLLLLQL